MSDEEIRVLGVQKSERELRELFQKDPLEVLIYLGSMGETERARQLKSEIQKKEREQITQWFKQSGLQDGVLIRGPDEDKRCIIGVNGGRFDVELAPDFKAKPDEFIPGREVWVLRESLQIVKLRDSYVQGEAAPVTEVIQPVATDEATKVDKTPKQGNAVLPPPKCLRLRVKSRQEEIVVEAVPSLAQLKPAVGDTVRIIASLGVALDLLQRGRGDVLLGEVPDITYEDIGGLEIEMTKIRDAIEEPYVHPEVFRRYALDRPRGILLYGPPGCGKTMIAKAIANSLSKQIERNLTCVQVALNLYLALTVNSVTKSQDRVALYRQWRALKESASISSGEAIPNEHEQLIELEQFLNGRKINHEKAQTELDKINIALQQGGRSYFISIKGPELLSKWVGETESSIRGIFEMARERATFYTPVVLFFDELESMFSRRGSGISSDVQKTIVPQLLAEIDGIEETRNVIVIGASNRFDLIDPAVLRPGRLDFKIEIPRPNRNREAPLSILEKYLTPDVPFAPADLGISKRTQEILGPVASALGGLDDCMASALELVVKPNHIQCALLLNEIYRGGKPPAHQLRVCATRNLDSEKDANVLDTWRKEDGIVWQTVRSGELLAQVKDPAVDDGKHWVSTFPIVAPDTGEIWGALIIGYSNDVFSQTIRSSVIALTRAVAEVIHARRQFARYLTGRVLDILFHPASRLVITETANAQRSGPKPRTLDKPISDILSGAILESVVSRAKRVAVKEEIRGGTLGKTGVTWTHLYEAIKTECIESKDQYIFELYGNEPYGRDQAYHDTERFQVAVKLPPLDARDERPRWLASKQFAWRLAPSVPT